MALRLFRSTGHSTLLQPGETRQATHPAWVVAVTSGWIALACNVGVWRLLAQGAAQWRATLAAAALAAGCSAVCLSLLCWRRTFKPAATLLLFSAAVCACGLWLQQLPIESLWAQRPRALLPAWAAFLRGSTIALMLLLALVPIVWLWWLPLRRLPGPAQWRANLRGAAVGALLVVAGAWLAGAGA